MESAGGSEGLVTRARDATDKRYVALHPTAESQRIKALLEGAWAEVLSSASSRLGMVFVPMQNLALFRRGQG